MCTNQSRSLSVSTLVVKGISSLGGDPHPRWDPWGTPHPGGDPGGPGGDPYPREGPLKGAPWGTPTPGAPRTGGGGGNRGRGRFPLGDSRLNQWKRTTFEKCTSMYLTRKVYLIVPHVPHFGYCASLCLILNIVIHCTSCTSLYLV